MKKWGIKAGWVLVWMAAWMLFAAPTITKRAIEKEDVDLSQTDGGAPEYVNAPTSTGRTMRVQKPHGGMFPWTNEYNRTIRPGDIITKGPWVDVRAYSTLALALTAAANKTLLVASTVTISDNTTIPDNVAVLILRGGSFAVAPGKKLTINGPFDAGLHQVFSGSGTVQFGVGFVKDIYPQWWGALADGAHDDTSAIQSAIDSTKALTITTRVNNSTTLHNKVRLVTGDYFFSTLTIDHPVKISGDGMNATFLHTTSTGTYIISVTTSDPVEFSDLFLGTAWGVTQSASEYINFTPSDNIVNKFSRIHRVSFNDSVIAVRMSANEFASIEDCIFNVYSGKAIIVENTITPDAGDVQIKGNSFINGTGVGIGHRSSGGLRITDNKFSGGSYHYLGEYNTVVNQTGILLIEGNSFDTANSGNIVFNTDNTIHTQVTINSNHITVKSGTVGIYSVAKGYDFLYGFSVGGNTITVNDNATAMTLHGIVDGSIYPNHIWGQTGTTTGVDFGSSTGPITVHLQTMQNIDTEYVNSTAAETFIRDTGSYQTNAGDPNNAKTPRYVGDTCLDTTNGKWYKSINTAGNGWVALN